MTSHSIPGQPRLQRWRRLRLQLSSSPRLIMLIANALLFIAMVNWLPFEPEISRALALLTFTAIMWLGELVHLTITALLIPILAVLLGLTETTPALANYANPIIYMFMAGMAMSAALSYTGVDRVIAEQILSMTRGHLGRATFMLFGVTAGLSSLVSNTATTAVMLPLVLGLLAQLDHSKSQRTFFFMLLGLAYSASIGGIATMVGSPPNAIVSAQLGLDFVGWMKFGLPVALLLLPLCLLLLWLLFRPNLNQQVAIPEQRSALSLDGRRVLMVFALTVTLWLFSRPISSALGGVAKFDALVAIGAMVLLCGSGLVSWKEIERRIDLGILILFGGGLCLSSVLKSSGASVFLAERLQGLLAQAPMVLILLAVAAFVIFLTEISSNTASTALLAPIFAAMAEGLGVSPLVILVLLGVSASCAFMLPVATPPNAIVFGSGLVPQRVMMRAGLLLNLACIALLTLGASIIVS